MGFWSWLTGRDEKESDVYANYEVVGEVTTELNRIASQTVGNAAVEVANAINQLNSVRGFEMVSEPISVSGYDSIFQSISESIRDVGTQLNDKAENIKAFEESSPLEKFGSTVCMGLFKVGEGLLSVAEDLGDAVVSVVGWGAGLVGAKDFQEDCANFVKKEWSHDAFNFYYNSDFAKASLFTEDSALAGGFKIVGKTIGYLYAGGTLAGQLGWGEATNMGIGMFKASGTTWAATIAQGVGGLGAGAESALNQGLSYNEAMVQGLKSGGTSAALAFAGGKISETMQAHAALKAASSSSDETALALVNSSDDVANAVANSADDVANASSATWRQALKESANYQGYTDSFTNAGIRFGEAQRNVVTSAKDLLTARTGLKTGDPQMLTDYETAKQGFKDSLSTLAKENPLSQGYNATLGRAVEGAKQFGTSVSQDGLKQTLANGATNLKTGVTETLSNIKANGILHSAVDGAKSLGTTALKVATNPMTYSVGATALASNLNEKTQQTGITIKNMAEDADVKLVSTVTGEDPLTLARAKYYGGETSTGTGSTGGESSTNPYASETFLPDPDVDQVDPYGGGEPTTNTPDISPNTVPTTTPEDLSNGGNGGNGGNTNPITNPDDGGNGGNGGNQEQKRVDPVEQDDLTKKKTTENEKTTTKSPIDLTDVDKLNTNPTSNDKTNTNTTPVKQVSPADTTPIKTTNPSYTTPTIGVGKGTGTGTGTNYSSGTGSDTTGKHTGGGYGEDGYSSFDLEDSDKLSELDELVKSGSSIDEIIKNSKYAKIPSSTKPISAKSSGKSSAIPIAAGLTVAAAAGIGAKAYIDHKNQNSEEDDEFADDEFGEDDSFETEEWMPNIDELELGEEDPNAAGFGDNDMASAMIAEDLVEV